MLRYVVACCRCSTLQYGASLGPSPEELGGPFDHLQPHRGDGALVEQRGLGQGPQRVQRLLEQLAAQVRIIPWITTTMG